MQQHALSVSLRAIQRSGLPCRSLHAETSAMSVVGKTLKGHPKLARKPATPTILAGGATIVPPALLNSLSRTALASHGFIVQNAEEPMSNPVADSEDADKSSASVRESAQSGWSKAQSGSTLAQPANVHRRSAPLHRWSSKTGGIAVPGAWPTLAACARGSISASPQRRSRHGFNHGASGPGGLDQGRRSIPCQWRHIKHKRVNLLAVLATRA
jgi:hypothetical protein